MLSKNFKCIDLSHPINAQIPTWDGSCGFDLDLLCDYENCDSSTKFRVQKLNMKAGAGTHLDAPLHCFSRGKSIDQIPLKDLVLPSIVINVADKAKADYQLSIVDIQNFESDHGNIPSNHLVIIYTGWSKYWNDPSKYRSEDSQGHMHFPSVSSKAAEYLLERNVNGLAIDTLSPDLPGNDYPVHRLFLGAGKYIIENIAQANQLPPRGAQVIAAPLKIEGGTEAPLRMIGIVPND